MTKRINILMFSAFLLFLFACKGTDTKKESDSSMDITNEVFGELNGQIINRYTLTNNNGMSVKILNYGCIINEINVPDRDGQFENITFGFDKFDGYFSDDYIRVNPNFGAVIGRIANRTANAQFELDGKLYKLDVNDGPHHLHGGLKGFGMQVWDAEPIIGSDRVSLKLTYFSKDMEAGCPGNMTVVVTYSLNDNNQLVLDYEAITDKATYCNLTNHAYFNLSARKSDILNHELMLLADQYTDVDATLIPTGNLIDVKGTPMDFTTPTIIGKRINDDYEQLTLGNGYDHNWVLRNSDGKVRLVASLYDSDSGRFMEVLTDQPGIQFYCGNFLDGSFSEKDKPFGFRSGLVLETQHFPDSPNKPNFPSTLLKPGEKFNSQTIFQFSIK